MIKVYSKDACPQCRVAIGLLRQHGYEPEILKLGEDYTKEQLLELFPGVKSLPVVVFDDQVFTQVQTLAKFLGEAS